MRAIDTTRLRLFKHVQGVSDCRAVAECVGSLEARVQELPGVAAGWVAGPNLLWSDFSYTFTVDVGADWTLLLQVG